MNQNLARPPEPTRHRIDVDAYYKMVQAGVLTRDDRVELIDGDIIDMNAIGSPHAAIVSRLNRAFAPAAADGLALVSIQNPLRLDAYNEPEPDLMLLKPRADDYRDGHPGADDVLLLVEVSDSSLAYDRGRKLALYARFAIAEVWIVDIAGAAIEVCRAPAQGAYAMNERRTQGALAPARVPTATLDIETLLR